MNTPDDYAQQREKMVREQIKRRGVRDPQVLDAMRKVPRHLFVPEDQRRGAYSDGALPLALGQTISQPYIVALMTELLHLQGGETVLEIGTGSGYQAAVLAQIAGQVHTVERLPELAARARGLLASLGIENVTVHVGDGTLGLPEFAPYQGILVTAAAPKTPSALLAQLDEGARLVIPVGGRRSQSIEIWQKQGERYTRETHIPGAFVPLIGEDGW
jgi:protein-L-isoaspartate(D-aspartate) O-methyltransferase